MSGKVPFQSCVYFLEQTRLNLLQGGYLGLWSGAHVPADGDTLATYTPLEVAWAGYVRAHVVDWAAAFLDAGNVARTQAGVYTWTFPGGPPSPVTINGVFFTEPGETELLYAERFVTGGIVLTNNGDPVSYQPRFGDVSRF